MTTETIPTEKDALVQKNNYMQIEYGWGNIYILPYLDGVAIQKHLINAESLNTDEYSFHKITPIVKDNSPKFTVISQQDYLKLKMRTLLKLTAPEE